MKYFWQIVKNDGALEDCDDTAKPKVCLYLTFGQGSFLLEPHGQQPRQSKVLTYGSQVQLWSLALTLELKRAKYEDLRENM